MFIRRKIDQKKKKRNPMNKKDRAVTCRREGEFFKREREESNRKKKR